MERATGTEILGCGTSHSLDITLNIQTTTGGNFSISVNGKSTVEHLKKLVSKKLRVAKDRICLLHRERQLREGTMEDNGLLDGSRVILLPSVETGLLTQRPENSVMQALESLNDSQVNDFLSGKSPLNLTMRLGDHMMLIQLQLSTLNPAAACGTTTTANALRATRAALSSAAGASKAQPQPTTSSAVNNTVKNSEISTQNNNNQQSAQSSSDDLPARACNKKCTKNLNDEHLKSFLRKQDIETLQNAFELFKSLAEIQEDLIIPSTSDTPETEADSKCVETQNDVSSEDSGQNSANSNVPHEEQSPIKSLSYLVTSPSKLTAQTLDTCNLNKNDAESSSNHTRVPLPQNTKPANSIQSDCEENCKISQDEEITSQVASMLTPGLVTRLFPEIISASDEPGSSTTENVNSSMDINSDQGPILMESPLDEYPMENLFNNAIDRGLFQDNIVYDSEISNLATTSRSFDSPSGSGASVGTEVVSKPRPPCQHVHTTCKNKRLHYLLHKTSKCNHPISQSKQKAFMASLVNKHIKRKLQQQLQQQQGQASSNSDLVTTVQPSTSNDMFSSGSRKLPLIQSSGSETASSNQVTKPLNLEEMPIVKATPQPISPTTPVTDTKALIEASKNLTQTLKKLSKEVLTNKVDRSNGDEVARSKIGQGAVIESMKHHGKGIYSGTFSGTLNPALQDRYGRPKRDISTIIHILNDLLCAAPPMSTSQREQHRHSTTNAITDSCGRCSQQSCAYGECNGHYTSSGSNSKALPALPCLCRLKNKTKHCHHDCKTAKTATATNDETMEVEECCSKCLQNEEDKDSSNNDGCTKCHSANTLAIDNSKTKCKLDQLRLVMQQKKEKREARKLKTMPYNNPIPSKSISQQESKAEEIDSVA